MDTQYTQLTSAFGYDTNNMFFTNPVVGSIPNSEPPINFRRIYIGTKNPDGSIGELIIPTTDPNKRYRNNTEKPELFSFGVAESKDLQGKVNGWKMPVCLYNKDNPTQHERDWVTTFNAIVEKCKDHIMEVKDQIQKYDLERVELKKLNPLHYKRDKGKIVEGAGPTLYLKIIERKKDNTFLTQFYDYDGNQLDADAVKGKYCLGRYAVKFESIFIGTKISLQIKLYEAEVRVQENGMKRLLSRPRPTDNLIVNNNINQNDDDNDDDDEEAGGSLAGSDDEEVKEIPKVVKKKVIRKVKKVSAGKN